MSKAGNPSSDTDLQSVTVLRKSGPITTSLKSTSALSAAQRSGAEIETSRKMMGGTNKNTGAIKSAAKLDGETEELRHAQVGLDTARLIQQARQKLEWSQKDLATKINEKQTVVNEIESGKAVLNQQILGKMERALGVHLRGNQKGQPLQKKPGKK